MHCAKIILKTVESNSVTSVKGNIRNIPHYLKYYFDMFTILWYFVSGTVYVNKINIINPDRYKKGEKSKKKLMSRNESLELLMLGKWMIASWISKNMSSTCTNEIHVFALGIVLHHKVMHRIITQVLF